MTRPRERSPEGGNKEEGFITWGMGGRRECLSREVTRSEVCSPRPALCHMLALSPDSPSLQVDVCLRRGQKPSHRSRETTSQAALSRASRTACLCHPQPGVSLLGSGFPTGAPGASADSVEDEERSVSVSGLGSAVVGSEDTVI